MRSHSARRAIAGLAVVASVGLVTACSSSNSAPSASSSKQLQVLKYGLTGTSAGDLDIYVGQSLGFFAKHGLEVQTVTVSSGSATDLVNLVAAGDAQIVDALPDPVVAAAAHTAEFKVMNEIHTLPERLVARTGITTMAQVKALKTVRVAVSSPTTSVAALSRFMLEQNGIPASKVQFIVLGGSAERLAALKAGKVDVGLLTQPSDFVAESDGLKIIADSAEPHYAPYYGTTDITTASTISKDCGMFKDYYAAIRQIQAYTEAPANQDKVAGIIAKATKTTTAIAQSILSLYKTDGIYPGVNNPEATVAGTAKLDAALGTQVVADPASLVDTSCTK